MNEGGERPWSAGFCDCFNPLDLCCLTTWCPCITYGRTQHRLNKDPYLIDYSCCNLMCCGWCLLAHCHLYCIANMIQRSSIRNRSSPQLTGGSCGDFFRGWCCPCCDLIQQEKEAQALLANRPPVVIQQPGMQQGMMYGVAPA